MYTFISLSLYLLLNAVDSKIPIVLSAALFTDQRETHKLRNQVGVVETKPVLLLTKLFLNASQRTIIMCALLNLGCGTETQMKSCIKKIYMR